MTAAATEADQTTFRPSRRLQAANRLLADRMASGAGPSDNAVGTLFTLLKPYRWFIVTALALNAAHGIAIAFQNFILPLLIDAVTAGERSMHARIDHLLWLCLAYFLISVIGRMTVWHVGYRLFTHVRERLICILRSTLYRHVNHLCLRFHIKNNSGELLAYLFGSPINQIVQFYQQFAVHFAGAIVTLVVSFGILATIDWQLTVLLSITLTITVWILRVARNRIKVLHSDYQATEGDVSGEVGDLLRGSRAVKLYAMERRVAEQFDDYARRLGQKSYRRDVYGHMEFMKQELTFYSAFAVTTLVAGLKYLSGDISLAAFSAYPLNFIALQLPLQSIFNIVTLWGGANAGLQRINTILRTSSTTPDPSAPTAEPSEVPDAMPLGGEVRFEQVVFRYEPHLEPALRGFDVCIPAGQKVALVGPSGAGKSTITQLLLRFYDPDEGRVTIDGVDLRQVAGMAVRNRFGVVPQEPFIFRTSVRENVRVTAPETDEATVIAACQRAHCWEFIRELPDGLDTRLGESGLNLSGGQRQRLAIARVLLHNPRFYIFDEATSALDSTSEQLIQRTLEHELGHATVFFIAHRLATVRHCDRILVIDRGRIAQDGSYDELVTRPGLFRDLVQGQQLSDG